MTEAVMIPLPNFVEYPPTEMIARSAQYLEEARRRRTVRKFSERPVPIEVIHNCLLTAGTAPNGANKQPWHCCVVQDPEVKHRIRIAAEAEEEEFYSRRASEHWLEDLIPFGTNAHKPYLEIAPVLIPIFARSLEVMPDGSKEKLYYVQESVGIATGMLISAPRHAGLATLTHTPSPMKFLNEILDRPAHERPFLLLVVGYPAEDAEAPDIHKKPLEEIVTHF